jgi:hypothetical protein
MDRRKREDLVNKLSEHNIYSFWYFSYIDNLDAILQYGILPKNEVERRGLQSRSFAIEQVQDLRHNIPIRLTNNQEYTLHDVVPVYLRPKTPSLSRRREKQDQLFFVKIPTSILLDEGFEYAFTDGNAASAKTRFFVDPKQLSELPWDVIEAIYWTNYDDCTRKRNSEFLIFPHIPINRFAGLGVSNDAARERVREIIVRRNFQIRVSVRCDWFFPTAI